MLSNERFRWLTFSLICFDISAGGCEIENKFMNNGSVKVVEMSYAERSHVSPFDVWIDTREIITQYTFKTMTT